LENRSLGKKARELAGKLETVVPGLLEDALAQYEAVSSNYLEEPDTFIHQVALVIVGVIRTKKPHMAVVTSINDEEYRFTAQLLDGALHFGIVDSNVSDWLKSRPYKERMTDETS